MALTLPRLKLVGFLGTPLPGSQLHQNAVLLQDLHDIISTDPTRILRIYLEATMADSSSVSSYLARVSASPAVPGITPKTFVRSCTVV